ncbi:MAG TPA: GAF domain-containing protein, partial [Chthoniobacteraceae bacterium]|nr:GAF domain-containing protein [Chthoniobacteraceae bacterium]
MSVAEPVSQVDLTNCGREPIHIPGAIQPHGAMVVLDERTLAILQVSANVETILGDRHEDLLNRPIDRLFPRALLEDALAAPVLIAEMPLHVRIKSREFDVVLHRVDDLVIVEFEPVDQAADFSRFYRSLQQGVSAVQRASSLPELYNAAAETISRLSGFERVMVYKFDEEWNGQVVGEKLEGNADSYLGQHFPASDIPPQARELYRRNLLRIIPSSTYTPAPILPAAIQARGPLNLSDSVLRSVSPIHLEYLRNMGVAASMSVSLLKNGELWGLIACHHSTPRTLPYNVRAACELIGQVTGAAISGTEERARLDAIVGAQKIQTQFFDYLAQEDNVLDALAKYTPRLLELVDATGAALCFNGGVILLGRTPAETEVRDLVEWVRNNATSAVFSTNSLPSSYPAAREYQEAASGIMAISLSREGRNFILWFRPQVEATIVWAGNPEKPVFQEGMRIHPRKSFEVWRQKVTGCATPWREIDIYAAQELRNAINALI